jgi:hypothetical protein
MHERSVERRRLGGTAATGTGNQTFAGLAQAATNSLSSLKSLNTFADSNSLKVNIFQYVSRAFKFLKGSSAATEQHTSARDSTVDLICSVLARANSDHYRANDDLLSPSRTRTHLHVCPRTPAKSQHQTIQRVSDSIKRSRQELFSIG